MNAEVFDETDVGRYTVAADTTHLRRLWVREANGRMAAKWTATAAILHANEAVEKAIRRRKRKGRR